ncbi:MAG TPA: PEGA domain-containing protein [Polyangia bacterium]|nr:PEGA domain-containing protein [Polyangia bacterium]
MGTLLLVLASWPAASAVAAEAGTPTAVLGLEPLEGVPDALAADITDAVRQRVAATKDYQLLQGKDLVEVKLVFACPDEAPACLSQAGKSLGAAKLIYGNVKKTGDDYQVTLKLLDVARAVVESFTADTIPGGRANATALRQLAPIWLAKLSGKGNGSITVRANLTGAAVSLDGTRVGVTGSAPVVVSDLSPGKHEVAVEKSGYTTTKQDFTLAAGQSLPLTLDLSPVSVEVPKPRGGAQAAQGAGATEPLPSESNSHAGAQVGFWIAVVGTAASAGLAVKFGLDVRDINKQLDAYRRFSCTSSTGICDSQGKTANPLTAAQNASKSSLVDQGNRDQTLQWVFVGVGGAFAVAGGYLLYKGYLASDGTQSASNHGLRIFPTATASARGIVAEFDF